jgi:TetR/AcrR family transcriptional repressor of nem operon
MAIQTDTKERIFDSTQALVLEKGFSATSLDDILKATGITKGAFFHHFRSKADLAKQLVERFAENDFAIFEEWSERADALSEDAYQSILLFIKFFEEWIDGLDEPFAGCLFAVYVYESQIFDPEVNEFVSRSFARWQQFYREKFDLLLAERTPATPVAAEELAETMVSLLEGAFILARSSGDPTLITRQSAVFRRYLKLLFE